MHLSSFWGALQGDIVGICVPVLCELLPRQVTCACRTALPSRRDGSEDPSYVMIFPAGVIWSGIELSASRDRNVDRLKHALARLRIWPFEVKAGEIYGRLYAELRRMGRPMQVIDIQIAAIALCLGNCTVVSKDSDLSAVPGLNVENWATP